MVLLQVSCEVAFKSPARAASTEVWTTYKKAPAHDWGFVLGVHRGLSSPPYGPSIELLGVLMTRQLAPTRGSAREGKTEAAWLLWPGLGSSTATSVIPYRWHTRNVYRRCEPQEIRSMEVITGLGHYILLFKAWHPVSLQKRKKSLEDRPAGLRGWTQKRPALFLPTLLGTWPHLILKGAGTWTLAAWPWRGQGFADQLTVGLQVHNPVIRVTTSERESLDFLFSVKLKQVPAQICWDSDRRWPLLKMRTLQQTWEHKLINVQPSNKAAHPRGFGGRWRNPRGSRDCGPGPSGWWVFCPDSPGMTSRKGRRLMALGME